MHEDARWNSWRFSVGAHVEWTAEAASNFLITPPIPATGSCRVICSVVNLTSQTQTIMGVVVHDATDAEVSIACRDIPDGAICSTTTTARSVGKSPFYCMFITDPGPLGIEGGALVNAQAALNVQLLPCYAR